MKDMFTYHNKCKTIKIAVQTANFIKANKINSLKKERDLVAQKG